MIELETTVVVDGVATPWSEPDNGLRARIVMPSTVVDARSASSGKVTPIALQLENVRQSGLRYDVCGVTSVPIPQPYHIECSVDGVAASQPKRTGAVIPASIGGLIHPPGTIRTTVLHLSHFVLDGAAPCARPGRYRVKLGLQTRLLMDAGNPLTWQGRVQAPAIEVVVE